MQLSGTPLDDRRHNSCRLLVCPVGLFFGNCEDDDDLVDGDFFLVCVEEEEEEEEESFFLLIAVLGVIL